MGRRGPLPIARGVRPTPGAMPDRPKTLTVGARGHWDRLSTILHPLGLLADTDATALGHLCELLALSDDVLKRIKGKSGDYGRNVRQYLALQASVLTRLDSFGLTPGSRVRLRIEPRRPEPELRKPPLRLRADESALDL